MSHGRCVAVMGSMKPCYSPKQGTEGIDSPATNATVIGDYIMWLWL